MRPRRLLGLYLPLVLLAAALGVLPAASLNAQEPAQPSPEVRALLDQGRAADRASRKEEASTLFNRALELARQKKDRTGEGLALTALSIAIVYEKPAEAQKLAEQALEIYRQLGDRTRQGSCHLLLGNVAQITSQPSKALAHYEEAAKLAQESGNRTGYANCLHNMAAVYIRTGQPYQALEVLQRALPIYGELGDKEGAATAYGNLGAAYRNARDLPRAMEALEKALGLVRELGLKPDEGIVLLNLGLAQVRVSGPAKALEYYDTAIPLLEAAGDKRSVAAVLVSKAEAYELAGELFRALEAAQQARKLLQEVGDRGGVGRSLANQAALYEKVGQPATALELYQQALQASQEASDLFAQMTILNDLGQLYGRTGRRKEERDCYARSLRLHEREGSFPDARAGTLMRLSSSLSRSGAYAEALEHSQEAWGLFQKANDRSGEAFAELQIGRLQERLGQAAQARSRYEHARSLFQDLRSGPGEAEAAGALATLEENQHRRPQAEQYYTRALGLLEDSRASLGRLTEAKSGYLEQQLPLYQRYIRFLLQTGQNARAFEWTQKAKGRVLVDMLEAGQVDVSGAMTEADRRREQALKQSEKALSNRWQAAVALVEHLQRQPQADQNRTKQAKAETEAIRRQQQQQEREWRAFRDDLYLRNPTLAQQRAARMATLEEVAKSLPADTALLEYLYLKSGEGAGAQDEVALFVVTRESGRGRVKLFRTTVEANALARMATEFREACAGRPGTAVARPFQEVARRLYRLLIAPAEPALARKQRLILCPDGTLWDVPFQALLAPAAKAGKAAPNRAPYLWERFSIVYGYSGTAVRAAQRVRVRPNRPHPLATLLVIANPTFGRVPATASVRSASPTSEGADRAAYLRSEDLRPLPFAQSEARAIAASFPDATLKLTEEAQETLVKQSGPSYRHLHFATHALFNDAAPMLSGIVLARPPKDSPEDGILTARELFDLPLAANMVVLSACDTARGSRRRGEGVIGLTWALFVAGSPTQVVSQWAVDDQATARLMGGFYQALKNGRSRDAALRGAALALLRDGQHQHPFYWAPFLVMGDWR